MEVSGEELFREELSGVNGDDRKSPKRNSAEGNCPKRNGLGVNYYEELSGEELSYNPQTHHAQMDLNKKLTTGRKTLQTS